MQPTAADRRWMRVALALAAERLGRVAPNPAVGCVLVKQGRLLAQAATAPGGRPHAESQALQIAGPAARDATAYVSLEPCAHQGQTGPCAAALIEAGIARVVIACRDPDPRTAGKGIDALREAGIAVVEDCLAEEAKALNAGFFSRIERRRPLVTLKLASSLDGALATHSGHSQWITGPAARAAAHGLRASHDAIGIGIGTALNDDPLLTARLPGVGWNPARIVFDRRLRLSLTGQLAQTAKDVPTILVAEEPVDPLREDAFREAGLTVLALPKQDEAGHVQAALRVLAERGITRLMVEGGARLAAALLAADCVDRIAWFRAGMALGDDAIGAVAPLGLDKVTEARRFALLDQRRFGPDIMDLWQRVH